MPTTPTEQPYHTQVQTRIQSLLSGTRPRNPHLSGLSTRRLVLEGVVEELRIYRIGREREVTAGRERTATVGQERKVTTGQERGASQTRETRQKGRGSRGGNEESSNGRGLPRKATVGLDNLVTEGSGKYNDDESIMMSGGAGPAGSLPSTRPTQHATASGNVLQQPQTQITAHTASKQHKVLLGHSHPAPRARQTSPRHRCRTVRSPTTHHPKGPDGTPFGNLPQRTQGIGFAEHVLNTYKHIKAEHDAGYRQRGALERGIDGLRGKGNGGKDKNKFEKNSHVRDFRSKEGTAKSHRGHRGHDDHQRNATRGQYEQCSSDRGDRYTGRPEVQGLSTTSMKQARDSKHSFEYEKPLPAPPMQHAQISIHSPAASLRSSKPTKLCLLPQDRSMGSSVLSERSVKESTAPMTGSAASYYSERVKSPLTVDLQEDSAALSQRFGSLYLDASDDTTIRPSLPETKPIGPSATLETNDAPIYSAPPPPPPPPPPSPPISPTDPTAPSPAPQTPVKPIANLLSAIQTGAKLRKVPTSDLRDTSEANSGRILYEDSLHSHSVENRERAQENQKIGDGDGDWVALDDKRSEIGGPGREFREMLGGALGASRSGGADDNR